MSVITDSYSMNIQIIQHGLAKIVTGSVIFPATVDANTPFDITYIVKNEGLVTDTLFGRLKTGGNELPGSAWTQEIAADGTTTKTYNHPGINETTTILIEVGHN